MSPDVVATSPESGIPSRPPSTPIKHPAALWYVEWEDHHSQDSWVSDEDVDAEPITAQTIGWLLKETDKVIVLFSNYAGKDNSKPYSNTMTILKKTILRRAALRAAPTKKKNGKSE